jgi:hypothetical protein
MAITAQMCCKEHGAQVYFSDAVQGVFYNTYYDYHGHLKTTVNVVPVESEEALYYSFMDLSDYLQLPRHLGSYSGP